MQASFKTISFGVVADTHIPDRMKQLPDQLLPSLKDAKIDRILHAGDACTWRVVRTLERVAPVTIIQEPGLAAGHAHTTGHHHDD